MTVTTTLARLFNRPKPGTPSFETERPTGRFVLAATGLAVVGTGMAAGFFYTYQVSVTRGLARVDDQTYVATFQAINATIRNALFGLVFFGTFFALLAALAVCLRARSRGRWAVLTGFGLYLAVVVVTFAGNVALNDQLATADARSKSAAALAREEFEHTWNQLNLARTLLSLGAFIALVTTTHIATDRRKA
jgi:uncharacterized membrane protein